MLKFGFKQVSVLVSLALVSGCVADARGPSPKSDKADFKLVLDAPQFSENGVATLTMMLTNQSGVTVCTAPNTNPAFGIDIISKRTGLRVFDQPEDSYLDVTATPVNTIKNISRFIHLVTVSPNKNFSVTVMIEPLRGAYFVDTRNVYVKDFVKGHPLAMQASIFVFNCKYKNRNEAFEAEDFIEIRSNTVALPLNMSGFIQ